MQINLIKNSLWSNSTQMLIFLVMVVSVLFWPTWFTWVPSSIAWIVRNRLFQIQNDDEERLFDEIGVRLQIRYKSLKASSTNGAANDDVRETEASVVNHTEPNRDNICKSCELQKILLALGLLISLIIVAIIVGIILNDKNNEASKSITTSTTTSTTSTTSTTTLHWDHPDYSP